MAPLDGAVSAAYEVFSRYKIGTDLVVCHCPVCMTEAVERELVTTPLRQISAATLAEYTNSAHGYDRGRIADEFRYLLPRYFELIAAGTPPCTMGIDICLRRLGEADYRTLWPRDETSAVDAFFDEVLRSVLILSPPDGITSARPRASYAIMDVLTMIVTAGGDVGRCLGVWDEAQDPQSSLHICSLLDDIFAIRAEPALSSPYFERHGDQACQIGRWLLRKDHRRKLLAAAQSTDDEEVRDLLIAASEHSVWQRFG